MTQRMASAPTADALRALHARFPGDTIFGVAGTLGDGVLAALGAASNMVTYQASGRTYTLTVYDGAPESNSGWIAEPGTVLPEITITGTVPSAPPANPAAGPPPVPPPPAASNGRSKVLIVALAALAAFVLFRGVK